MKLMRKHPEQNDLNLGSPNQVVGQAKHCTACLVANRRLGARAAYKHGLTKAASSLASDSVLMWQAPSALWALGEPKYILMVVDAFTRFPHVMPMRRKAQAASLLAQTFERFRVQVIRQQNKGDKGGKFMSPDLEFFCALRGIVHTFLTQLHISPMVLQSEGLAS